MQVGEVKAGEGSFEYLGSNRMASVSVGVDWFVKEMKKMDFYPAMLELWIHLVAKK